MTTPNTGDDLMGTLTAVAVKVAMHDRTKGVRPIRVGDGDGLYLQIAAGDTKSWLFRYTLRGKAREMGLGAAGEPPDGVPLSQARVAAGEARALLRQCTGPLVTRAKVRAAKEQADVDASEHIFRAEAMAFIESKKSGWRNAKHAAQWL